MNHIPDDTKCWWIKCKLQGGLEPHLISPTVVLAPVCPPVLAYDDRGEPFDQHIEKEKCKLIKYIGSLRMCEKKKGITAMLQPPTPTLEIAPKDSHSSRVNCKRCTPSPTCGVRKYPKYTQLI